MPEWTPMLSENRPENPVITVKPHPKTGGYICQCYFLGFSCEVDTTFFTHLSEVKTKVILKIVI